MQENLHTEIFYGAWEHIVNLFNDCNKFICEVNFKETQGKSLKVLTSKQMLLRLPITLALVKADNASVNLLNGIRQIPYSLYRAQEITKKVYNNIIKTIQILSYR